MPSRLLLLAPIRLSVEPMAGDTVAENLNRVGRVTRPEVDVLETSRPGIAPGPFQVA